MLQEAPHPPQFAVVCARVHVPLQQTSGVAPPHPHDVLFAALGYVHVLVPEHVAIRHVIGAHVVATVHDPDALQVWHVAAFASIVHEKPATRFVQDVCDVPGWQYWQALLGFAVPFA